MNDLEQFLRNMNQAWLAERYDELSDYLDDDVVMLPPGQSEPIVGADSLLESYRQFSAAAKIHHFKIEEIRIFEHPSMAMTHLKFSIDYELEENRNRETGLDICAVSTSGTKPSIVWRTVIVLDEAG